MVSREFPFPYPFFEIIESKGPVVATAIHSGHELRPEVAAISALGDGERLREEDPYTDSLTKVAGTQVVVHRSRFEVDLNRPRGRAVYVHPEDAWGLQVWRDLPPHSLLDRSLSEYDAFYEAVHVLLRRTAEKNNAFLVLDFHSYNHRREGDVRPPAPSESNPEVNVGTGSLDRGRWAPIVDCFMARLHEYPFLGRHLDVRENVKFRGGHFPAWVNRTFPDVGCALAIEFKKFFMDEWTGAIYSDVLEEMINALKYALEGAKSVLDIAGDGGCLLGR